MTSLVHLLRKLTADRVSERNRSPMLKRINQTSTKNDTLLCIVCGIVFAALTVSFFI